MTIRSLLLIPLASATAVAQTVPSRTLTKPDVEYTEPFSQLVGVRELRDGRVVAADIRDKTLQAIDFVGKRATPIGREGSGPGEWMLPMVVLPMPGDSTLVFDIGNTRYLVVGPDAKPVRTFNLLGDVPDGARVMRGDAGARGAGGRGDGGRGDAGRGGDAGRSVVQRGGPPGGGGRVVFGGGGGLALGVPRITDARGRTYSQGLGLSVTDAGTIVSADSAPILRYDMTTKITDTVAYVNLAKNAASGSARGDARGGGEMQVRIGGLGPYAPADDWIVTPDGRVIVARVADYHLEVVQPGGRRVAGPKVAFAPVRVGEAEKEEWRAGQRGGTRVSVNIGGDAGRQVSTPPPTVQEPAEWPATKPPFSSAGRAGAMFAAPNGEVWVLRTRSANDKVPTADVFDAQARLVGRMVFPAGTRLVGLGPRGAYLVRIDDDDLQYLQRHPITWTGCPAEIREVCGR